MALPRLLAALGFIFAADFGRLRPVDFASIILELFTIFFEFFFPSEDFVHSRRSSIGEEKRREATFFGSISTGGRMCAMEAISLANHLSLIS